MTYSGPAEWRRRIPRAYTAADRTNCRCHFVLPWLHGVVPLQPASQVRSRSSGPPDWPENALLPWRRHVHRLAPERQQHAVDDLVLQAVAQNVLAEHFGIPPVAVFAVSDDLDAVAQLALCDQQAGGDRDIVRAECGLAGLEVARVLSARLRDGS